MICFHELFSPFCVGFRTWLLQTLNMARKGEIPDPIFKEEKDKICDAFFGSSDDFYDSLSIGKFFLRFLFPNLPILNANNLKRVLSSL